MEGQQCDKCKGSFFNLQSDEPEGCIPCFCFQLSKDCKCADFYKDIVSHNTCGKKKFWNDFKSQNKMQSIVALRTPRYYGPFNNQGEQPNPRQKSIADVWLKESSATMDSCYYENLLTVPGVSTTGGSSVHAQCLSSVFLYWAVCFDLFFLLFLVRLLSCVCFHILANTKPNWIVVTCYRWYILEILLQKIPAVVTQFAIYTSTQYTLFDIPPSLKIKNKNVHK